LDSSVFETLARKRFTEPQLTQVNSYLQTASEIIITTHHRPDGDAMGSSLALYNYLLRKGHKPVVITPSAYPGFLTWLPGNENVINYEAFTESCNERIKNADLIFCLDFNWLNRVEKMEDKLRTSKAKKVLIDHHLDPEKVYDVSFSYTDACSTCELIYDFIIAMNDKSLINKTIAECIYCGIMTDTNSFRFSSMKSRTHLIIADLMDAGAENYRIHERVYDTSSESKLKLLGYALFERLVVLKEFNTAYIALSEQELNRFNYQVGDTEGFVNYALSIQGIQLAVFFAERDGGIKISLRSKNEFSVQELSLKYFNGGGHKNASGGFSSDSLESTVRKFVELLPLYKDKLTK
jgi:phosphoesterase RecJ-like protein